jgi:hypothetical protein
MKMQPSFAIFLYLLQGSRMLWFGWGQAMVYSLLKVLTIWLRAKLKKAMAAAPIKILVLNFGREFGM